jgi:dTMP kinase
MYIAFEGPEGSGKGTQVELVTTSLIDKGVSAVPVCEPGGTPTGQAIREILLNRDDLKVHGATEAMLFSADRCQLINTVVIPALSEGKIVISDRSFYSTFAYQGYGRQMDIDLYRKLTEIAIGETIPDLCILLDLPVEEGLKRKREQGEFNKLDAETIEFHKRVRSGYLELASHEIERWEFVDANRPIFDVYADVKRLIYHRLSLPL